MNTYLKKYLDNQIIREYADKSIHRYSLNVVDVPSNEIDSLLDVIAKNDEGFRDVVLDYVQTLINERLPIVECKDRFDDGFNVVKDPITGEQNWDRRGYLR